MSSGRLESVNVGLPRDVPWEGRTVRTAIWKAPVAGPVMARRLDLDGDEQADKMGHGGEMRAVFVYQLDAYAYWERELGRDDFVMGQFGENLTVAGLPDDEVCVGDRYAIGGALFEVSQPRVTCYRLGIRMEDPRMPSLVVAHHRPGFYMRVLREGPVAAGAEIIKVAEGPEAMTIADIDALLYLPGRTPRDLERALRIPALSPGWRGSFADLLEQSATAAPTPPPAWLGFRPLRVAAIEPESTTITTIRLEPVDGDPPPPALPGQFLTVRVELPGAAAPVLRSYSLSGAGELRISVKREGVVSRFLRDGLAVGDVLEAGAPRGAFVLRAGSRPVVLLSAGVGATPALAMLHALAAERSPREVWWVHGARNGAEHAFAREVDDLLARLPAAHRLVAYSGEVAARGEPPPVARDDAAAFDLAGRLDGAALDAAGVPVEADYYLCGPPGFMVAIGAALAARGVAPDAVRTEVFGPAAAIRPGLVGEAARPPHPPAGAPGTGPHVAFARSDLAVPWDPAFGSLLELAEACDVPAAFSCRTGVCHTCATGLVEGEVAYAPEPLEPAGAGEVLLCCSRPRGPLVLDL
jgi:ferredoxin-NADP reductase/MOSC domain-containing protein YiiM/ferredoxin